MPPENDLQKEAEKHLAAEMPQPTSPPPPVVAHDPNSPLKQIRTFQGDVAEVLGQQHESLFSIREKEVAQAQQATPQIETQTVLPQEPRVTPVITGQRVAPLPNTVIDRSKVREFFLLTLGSFVLIALGLVGAWYGYQTFLTQANPPVIDVPSNRFISVQSSETLDATLLTRESLIGAILNQTSSVESGTLRHILLRSGTTTTSTLITTAEFLQKLKAQAPGSLVRAFDPNFMLGSLGQSRFLIIKISSFENAFPGMLTWEKSMATDIGPLFATAPLLTNIDSTSVFKDVISKNKDVRVLLLPTAPLASTTAPVLLYSFFDNQKLIITDSFETLQIIIDRLTNELLIH